MTQLSTLLDQIDSGTMLLPEFQRGYVWNRDQVRGLMRSVYRGHPVGSLLVWETDATSNAVRGRDDVAGVRHLLLDGQQRITSLYGIVRGCPPPFFEGDPAAFTNLHFNLEDETFEFYAPAKMADDPRWISVTELFMDGLEPFFLRLSDQPSFSAYLTRLNRLRNVLERNFHQEKITGSDKTVDVVVEIFNQVNSGGTKLSKGDLALAKICADWPEARSTMRGHLERWRSAGYQLNLDWLLRNVNAVATGRAQFSALDAVSSDRFEGALVTATRHVGTFLDLVAGRLGLDHDRVLMARYAFPVVCRYLHLNGDRFPNRAEQDRMLFWYVHAALWGRFAGSTETVLAQDYETVGRDGTDGLIAALERWRGGNLRIEDYDFEGFGKGSRFYPLLYLMTRVLGARDLGTGITMHSRMLGYLAHLQVHHVFPKALLYDGGYERAEVNSVANFCFLTQDTNLRIGKRYPEEYLAAVAAEQPGALESQWIPTDPDVWKLENYRSFLKARQDLLATAANGFLDGLRVGGSTAEPERVQPAIVTRADELDEREGELDGLLEELSRDGFGRPLIDHEIADPDSGRVLAVAEACWPDGLQTGQGEPVVLELDPGQADLGRLEELGFQVFTSVDSLRGFVRRRRSEQAALAS